MKHAERLQRFEATDLYVVISEAFCAGRPNLDVLDAVLDAGVTLIQLREKDWDDRRLYEAALAFRDRTRQAGAVLMIDDRVDIAIAVDADGVHLGQQDLPVAAARAVAPDLLIGVSTHDLDEAVHAQNEGASVINIGPIYPTQTKTVPTGAIGPAMLDEILPHVHVPWSCMGGIKDHNLPELVARGAKHPAVVTAVTAAEHPAEAARGLRKILGANTPAS